MIPYPDPIVRALLSDLPALADVEGRVSTDLDDILPAVRFTKVSDREAPSTWEATPIYQIEVWTVDEAQAGSIAWAVKNTWPTAKRAVVLDAVVHGRWVDTNPSPAHDTETGYYRFLLDVGVRLSGVTAP